ncbi:peptidoglycan D,D-transpeptidase FtsI family protein [Paenibacillus apiarius]|uniref:peptidoglycan D,D-transpeptidase FtsI family protein n=1 Tax=Paenibacillus apiarius TaxID=46240 RepID=UPI003B3ABCD4
MQIQTDEEKERRTGRNRRHLHLRMSIFFFVTFLVFTVLIVRIALLQFVQGPELRSQMLKIGTKSIEMSPIRGSIFEAAGNKLAYSVPTHSLYFKMEKNYTPEEALLIAAQIESVIERYGDPNKPMTKEMIYEQMDIRSRVNYGYVPRRIKIDLTEKEIAVFLENRDKYPYIDILEEGIRQYDEDKVAPQIIGYLRRYNTAKQHLNAYKHIDNEKRAPERKYLENEFVGFDGIELMYQEELRGANGSKTYPVNSNNKIIGPMELTKPERGLDIHLTLHKDVQLKTRTAIENHLVKLRNSNIKAERAPNAITGYAVAIEIKTGNIIAMANVPDYDTNVWRTGRIGTEALKQIGSNQYNGTVREVFQDYGSKKENNLHPSSLVYLGSTMKPLTVLIGLQEGLIHPSTTYRDIGYAEFGRKGKEARVHNASKHALGLMDPARSLSSSSNAFMVDMIGNPLYLQYGKEKGLEIWDRYMKAFGLGTLTGSGFPAESEGIRDYMQADQTGQASLAYASFGQQGKYTTLQLAQYAATLANHGKRLKPQFVSKITDASGKTIKKMKPEIIGEIKFKQEYWDTVERGMLGVGVRGFDGFPYKFVRKTGTSEQAIPGRKELVENAVFIAYAPAEEPVLAVAVVVPEGGYGAWGAAPIARHIFDAYDEHFGLKGKPRKKTDNGK